MKRTLSNIVHCKEVLHARHFRLAVPLMCMMAERRIDPCLDEKLENRQISLLWPSRNPQSNIGVFPRLAPQKPSHLYNKTVDDVSGIFIFLRRRAENALW